jgi:hypothetical protein
MHVVATPRKLAVLALVTVFAILAIMYFVMPPMG